MEFLRAEGSYTELGDAWARYRTYMESIKGQIPARAYDFATAPWHYNPADHRSLHDAWVEEVALREDLKGEGPAPRRLNVAVRLLGPYHDGHTYLSYSRVSAYRLVLPGESANMCSPSRFPLGHGDWLIDELRLSSSGALLHEVVFASGAHWLLECESVEHSTDIPGRRG